MDDKGGMKKKKERREAANLLRRGEESKWRFRRDVQTWTNFTPASPPPSSPPLPPPLLLLFLPSLLLLLPEDRKFGRTGGKQLKRWCFRFGWTRVVPRSVSVSVRVGVSLPLNLISKAHHVLPPVSKGTWPPSISLYAHGRPRYRVTFPVTSLPRGGGGGDGSSQISPEHLYLTLRHVSRQLSARLTRNVTLNFVKVDRLAAPLLRVTPLPLCRFAFCQKVNLLKARS